MQKLHNKLSEKMIWYAGWHKHPHHAKIHFLGFLLAAVGISIFLSISIFSYSRFLSALALPLDSVQTKISVEDINGVNDKLIKKLKLFETSLPAERSRHLENLRALLTSRENQLLEKMAKGDKELESQFLTDEIRQKLPEEVQALVESEISLQGIMSVIYVDGIREQDSYIDYELDVNEGGKVKNYRVYFEKDKQPYLKHGTKVAVKGMALADKIFIAPDSGQLSLQTSSAVVAADVAGSKSLLVILVNFTDNTSLPWTQDNVYNSVFTNSDSTNALIKEGSYNKVSLAGVTTNWLTINSLSSPVCNYSTWGSLADQAAVGAGYNVSSYNYVMYLLNGVSTSVCNWGGLAYVGGNRSWINGIYAAHGSKAHELGHNFGAWHSSFYDCGSQQIGPSCSLNEYGEYIAKMGAANNYQFNPIHRGLFGWIPATQIQTVNAGGIYTIYSDYSANTINPKILKLAKPNTGETYYIAFKQAMGFDASIPTGNTQGAIVYIWNGLQTKMLTMTPGAGYTNAALWDGGSFYDSANGITVTQLSHAQDSVTLNINLITPPCFPANPTISISPASKTGSAGSSLSYAVSVTNKNNSQCGPAVYSIIPTVPSGFSAAPVSLSLASGSTGSVNISITSTSNTVDGSYPFTITASDTSNAGFSANVNATYIVYSPIPDTTPPVVNISSPFNGSKVSKNVTISATATDNVKVTKVEFYIDGSRVATDSILPYAYKWTVNNRVTAGNHSITAKAYDAAGNNSSFSITVTK